MMLENERPEFDEPISLEENPELEADLNRRTHDLFRMSETEKNALIERINANNGMVLIGVHPFYFEYHNQESSEAENVQKSIIKAVKRILSKNKSLISPLIVFEEAKNVHYSIEFLKGIIENSNNEIYLIQTLSGESTPLIPEILEKFPDPEYLKESNDPELKDLFREFRTESWAKIREFLQELGVKEIIIGGLCLNLVQCFQKGSLGHIPSSCVGSAYTEFEKSFKVRFSNFTGPEKRSTVKNKI